MTDFKPMLAGKVKFKKDEDEVEHPVLTYPILAQEKLDGIRCAIVDGKALTRTLKEIPNREIFEFLSKPEFEGLDGEIVVGGVNEPDAYRTTVSFVMASAKTEEPWVFYVFDKWDDDRGYYERYVRASSVARTAATPKIMPLPLLEVEHEQALDVLEARFLDRGSEGLIVRQANAPYKFGRGSATKQDLLKLKRFEDSEAEIIGVVEEFHNANEATTNALGRTERSSHKANKVGKGTLGALVVKDVVSEVEFQIGTGFDAADRKAFWHYWSEGSLEGKVVKYKFFPVGVKDKPRHPVFMGFRDMGLDG